MELQARWLDRLITLRPNPVAAHGLALALVILATLVRLALDSFLAGVVPFATYFPAVLLATLAGGVAAGITAWVTGGLFVWFLIFPERYALSPITAAEATSLLVYSLTNLLIVVVAHRLRSAIGRLSEDEARLRATIESLPYPLMLHAEDGNVLALSHTWSTQTGYFRDELRTVQDWTRLAYPDRFGEVDRRIANSFESSEPSSVGEYMVRTRFGDRIWDFTNVPVGRLPDGRRVRLTAGIDVTERKRAEDHLERLVGERTRALEDTNRRLLAEIAERERAEAALARAQRLEAIGQLTGGVAHDFNNLLTVIVGNLDMIERTNEAPERVRRLAAAALGAAERGERLTRQLLAFARRQALRPEVADINRLIGEEEALIRRAVGEAVDVSFDLAADLGPCRIDVGQFEAALLNLVVNARDATPGGGRITVTTRNVTLPASGAPPELPAGDCVVVAVRDTGAGIAPDVLPRVFEPFFTTKDVGKGSGLGLSQVYGFVQQSGGQVRVDSVVGHGTAVEIWLPRSAEPLPTPEPAPAQGGAPHCGADETVLVVEDDADVRAMAVETLRGLGYRVVVAADGVEALEVLERPESIDLLFTDMVMPRGVGGAELARTARAKRPELRVLLTSGYIARPLTGEQNAAPDFPLLPKPYRGDELAHAVRAALSQPMAGAPDTEKDAAVTPVRVLVVEDDALVRMSTVELLGELGADVVAEADNAEEALRLFDRLNGFDVLLTDMCLPGMDGMALAAEARRRHPDLTVVLATGYGEDVGGPDGVGDLLILPKPFGSAELSRLLDRVRREPVE